MRVWPWLLVFFLSVAGCTEGSTTTRRPAADRPVVGPEGTFWDAVAAAQLKQPQRMRYVFSVRFLHRSILPKHERRNARDEADYNEEKQRQLQDLKGMSALVEALYAGYCDWLGRQLADRFVETEPPVYEIDFRDGFGAARGPNIARVKVNFHHRHDATKPTESIVVAFVQEGDAWRIDAISPDKLFGTFTP